MDAPQPAPDPALERRQLIIGVIIALLVLLLATAAITLLMIKSGGRGNYYNDIMERDRLKSEAGK